jgi:hypothetical protein
MGRPFLFFHEVIAVNEITMRHEDAACCLPKMRPWEVEDAPCRPSKMRPLQVVFLVKYPEDAPLESKMRPYRCALGKLSFKSRTFCPGEMFSG